MPALEPEVIYFADNKTIPNSKYPLLLYRDAFIESGNKGAEWLEEKFTSNNWTNAWRWGVYPFHHYHSNTHEVLGVFSGDALLQMGGEKGAAIKVHVGDILVIPAGVGHKNVGSSPNFNVVGAYPNGISPDLKKGEPGDRPQADKNISAVPIPATDPLLGKLDGLRKLWR